VPSTGSAVVVGQTIAFCRLPSPREAGRPQKAMACPTRPAAVRFQRSGFRRLKLGTGAWRPSPLFANVPYDGRMPELVFEVVQESDGGYCAECLTESIFTEADTWDDLRKNVLEATSAFFFDRQRPDRIRLHLVRDEVLQVA